jgi:hypothetical protein
MSYTISFTDTSKTPIVVQDNTVQDSLSLSFPGRNSTNFAGIIGTNFLHLLENFAATTEPSGQKIQGQLWFDTTLGVSQLKVYNGTQWADVGGIKKSSTTPTTSAVGDLWIDTARSQVYLNNGSSWSLVGPQYSSGQVSGAEPEEINAASGGTRTVVTLFINGVRVAIVSASAEFTPLIAIPGYTTIKPGVNLHSSYSNYYGTVDQSKALIDGSTVISAANVLRRDAESTIDYKFNIANNTGLTIGTAQQYQSFIEGTNVILKNANTISGDILLRVNTTDVLTVHRSGKIGVNNTSPAEALDVVGNATITGIFSSTTPTGTSIFSGNLQVNKDLRIKGTATFDNPLTVSKVTLTGAEGLIPTVTEVTHLGSESKKFYNIYAKGVYSDTFTGTLAGTANIAGKLLNSKNFSLTGDIASAAVGFNGEADVQLTTVLNNTTINTKSAITTLGETDELLISQGTGVSSTLKKITKANFWNEISQVKVGMVMPFAGTSIPTGWLLCDGEEKLQATYSALYASIGNTYGAAATNYFKLPNLTGKTILGSGTGELGQTGTFTAGTGASTIPWIKMYYIIYTGKDY